MTAFYLAVVKKPAGTPPAGVAASEFMSDDRDSIWVSIAFSCVVAERG
jgi:hypothetical protein